MSQTKPTDGAYLVKYYEYQRPKTALIIAPNPFQALKKADKQLPREGYGEGGETKIVGELREKVIEAQISGVSIL